MSITITWDNAERSTLRYCFNGGWDWEAFLGAFRQAETMLASVRHGVDLIVDFQNSGCVPTEVLARLAYVGGRPPRNLRRYVLVGTRAFAMTSFAVFGTYYAEQARRYQFAYTIDRARSMLGSATDRYLLVPGSMSA